MSGSEAVGNRWNLSSFFFANFDISVNFLVLIILLKFQLSDNFCGYNPDTSYLLFQFIFNRIFSSGFKYSAFHFTLLFSRKSLRLSVSKVIIRPYPIRFETVILWCHTLLSHDRSLKEIYCFWWVIWRFSIDGFSLYNSYNNLDLPWVAPPLSKTPSLFSRNLSIGKNSSSYQQLTVYGNIHRKRCSFCLIIGGSSVGGSIGGKHTIQSCICFN